MKFPICLALVLMLSNVAQAAYNYQAVFTSNQLSSGNLSISSNSSGVTATFTDGTGFSQIQLLNSVSGPFFVPGSVTLNTGNIFALSSVPLGATGQTYSVNYNLAFEIDNVGPPGVMASHIFNFAGTITANNLNSGNGTIINTFAQPQLFSAVIGDVFFKGGVGINPDGSNAFAPPTINTGNFGSVGGFVNSSSVPEPSSFILGLTGMIGLGLFRRLS